MTLSANDSRDSYACNGVTKVFPYTFRILDESHLQVILRDADGNETVLVLNTDYTVSGVDAAGGGNVTTTTAYAAGYTIVVLRDVPIDQETDYVENDPFSAESHEEALDKLTMIVQQQQEQIERCLKVPESSDLSGSDLELEPSASKVIGFDAAATAITTYATTAGTVTDFVNLHEDYADDVGAAIAAIGAGSKTIIVDRNTAAIAVNVTSPANIQWLMINGAMFDVSVGVTLTVYSPENILASPSVQVLTGAGVLRFTAAGKFHPGWWGALGDASTDDYAALQACIDSYKALMTSLVTAGYYYDNWTGPVLELISGRVYVVGTSLYTGGSTTSCLKWLSGNGATILGKTAGEPIIVNTGAHVWFWDNLVIEGDPVDIPECGIWLSRPLAGDGSGGGHFTNIVLDGSWIYGPVYNYGSEVNDWDFCWFVARAGQSAFILTNDNARGLAPAVGQAIAVGAQSSLTQNFRGCEFVTYDATAGVLTDHSCMEIDGWREVRLYDSEFNTDYGTWGVLSPNRPQILIKNTSVNPEFIDIRNCLIHGEYLYGVEIRGTNIVVKDLKITGCHWGLSTNNPDNGSYQVYTGSASAQLAHSWIEAPNVYFGAAGADIYEGSHVDIVQFGNSWTDSSGRNYFNVNQYFDGTLIAESTDNVSYSKLAGRFNGQWIQPDISGFVLGGKVFDFSSDLTTGATSQAVVFSATMPDEAAWAVTAWVVSKRSNTAARSMFAKRGLFYRDAGAGATIQGSVIDMHADLYSSATPSCTMGVSGNDVQVLVTPETATSTTWLAKVEILKVE